MKINQPVTDCEVIIPTGKILITRTDLEGKISDVNDAFIEISGFNRDELIGSEHNIVRHPDMPAEVFADLWLSLKAERPWNGVIKNRTKAGNYFWVEANFNPIYDKGQLSGYLSAFSAASPEQINTNSQLFENITNQKTHYRPANWLEKINFGNRLSIGAKIGLLGVLMILPAVILIKLLINEKDINIKHTQEEMQGLEYIIPLKQILVHSAQHRSLTDSYLHAASDISNTKIQELHKLVADEIKAVDQENTLYGEAFKST